MILMTRISAEAKQRSRQLRRSMTEAERQLWRHLRERQMEDYKFRRQHPLGDYVVDFVCLDAGLVIEVDGGQHMERSDYDWMRTRWLEEQGFRVLRFWNHEVLHQLEEVKAVIWRALHGESQPPSPLPPARGKELKKKRTPRKRT
jgi:very-short-patch-repair endonuclease